MGMEAYAADWPLPGARGGDLLELIELTGEPGFERALFAVANAATGCDRLTAIAFAEEQPPRLLAAAGLVSHAEARPAGRRRVEHYWREAASTGRLLRLSFYADRRSAGFSEAQRAQTAVWSELLLALIVKHDRLIEGREREGPACALRERLLQAAPDLSDREAEVCALIARGCTSEAIGLQLGISINTVKTYRKRAYGRLGISTQNELLRLAFA